ncbi:MAG: hypothetical protein ABIP74_03675 [Candidatus Saccharimonas sp.]
MKPSSHFVSSFDITIQLIVTGSPEFHDALQQNSFWHEFVPAFQYTRISNPQMTWRVTEAPTLDYDMTNHAIQATVETVKKVVIIIEAMFEHMRQERSYYTMHGCVIVRNNTAVALIGNLSGIGKTTLASYATSQEWDWITDEKFTISDGEVIGGTSRILDDEKTRLSAGDVTPTPFTHAYPLALICQPIVTDETSIARFDMSLEKAYWTLYDEVTRDIRQVNGVIDISLPALQSLDTDAISENRMRAIDTLTHAVPTTFLRGPTPLLLGEIEAILS